MFEQRDTPVHLKGILIKQCPSDLRETSKANKEAMQKTNKDSPLPVRSKSVVSSFLTISVHDRNGMQGNRVRRLFQKHAKPDVDCCCSRNLRKPSLNDNQPSGVCRDDLPCSAVRS